MRYIAVALLTPAPDGLVATSVLVPAASLTERQRLCLRAGAKATRRAARGDAVRIAPAVADAILSVGRVPGAVCPQGRVFDMPADGTALTFYEIFLP